MIGIKEAVDRTLALFKELYDTRKFEDIMLEEVELAEDKSAWRVTLGFARQIPSVNIMESIGSKKYLRTEKIFHIDAQSGEMLAMKNGRCIAGPHDSD